MIMFIYVKNVNSLNEEDLNPRYQGGGFISGGTQTKIENPVYEISEEPDSLRIRGEREDDPGAQAVHRRRLQMSLNRDNLRRILNVAINAKLIDLPGIPKVAQAKLDLEQALKELRGDGQTAQDAR